MLLLLKVDTLQLCEEEVEKEVDTTPDGITSLGIGKRTVIQLDIDKKAEDRRSTWERFEKFCRVVCR